MRPVTQTIFHDDPDGRPGNCLQACIASLLDLPLDDVPHFLLHDDWTGALEQFLTAHGRRLHAQPASDHCAYGMAWGPSKRGVRHAVVWADGRMAHDPHPSHAGLLHVTELFALTPLP
jgi:hypothetical protein